MPRRALRGVGLGLVLVLAAVLGLPSVATAATTTTVTGVVTAAGQPAADVLVGTWSPDRGTVASTTTDAQGRFVLRSPSAVPVVAFAGAVPSASRAVFLADAGHLVRGVIGSAAPPGTPSALAQTVGRALPGALGGGADLRFRLQAAGRFTASSPELGASADATGVIEVEHGDSFGPEYTASASGSLTSGWLVPGRYRLLWNPKPEVLPARTWVTVRAGETVAAAPPVFPVATTVRIRVTSGGTAVGAGVPAVERVGDGVAAVRPTDATGTLVVQGVAPGLHQYTVGQVFDDPDEGLQGPPSSDTLLPRTVAVAVHAGQATATASVDLLPASRLRGTVEVPRGTAVAVDVEDPDGNVVRTTGADPTTGAFSIGGLPAGSYSVFVVDLDRHRFVRKGVALPAAPSAGAVPTVMAAPFAPTTPMATVRGTVPGATGGSVLLASTPAHGATLLTQRATIHADGTWSLRSVQGRFLPVVVASGRVPRTAASIRIFGSGRFTFAAGARTAGAVARFAVRGHVVAVDVSATRGGTELDLTRAAGSRSTASGAAPGRYRWARVLGPLPAVDGPWTYVAPTGTFLLRAGATARLGTLPITIQG